MNIDTPLVEYLIIGSQTFAWLALIIMKIFGIPLEAVGTVEASKILLLIPFVYLLGMIVDDLIFHPLNNQRKKIQESIYNADVCKDEMIAFESEVLYSAYESRVRRVRIIGAAIFNLPLLGFSVLLHIGLDNPTIVIMTIAASLILCWVSYITWKNLYRRAYKFRKNAWDIIVDAKKNKKSK